MKKNNAITVHIYYTGENGSAKAFVKEMLTSGLVDEIRKEKGNRRYEYFFSVEDEETVLLVDSWDNQEAIDLHHASSIMDKITELRIKYHLHMKVERYFLDEDTKKPLAVGQEAKDKKRTRKSFTKGREDGNINGHSTRESSERTLKTEQERIKHNVN